LLHCFPPSTFSKLIYCFWLDLNGSFWETFGFGLIGMPWGPFSLSTNGFPHFNGGIRLISLEVIAPATYLRSWALVALVITSRFLLNFHPFLLEVIGVSNSRPLPFPTHLKLTQKLLPLGSLGGCSMCVPFKIVG
jgi:hypothetical protein